MHFHGGISLKLTIYYTLSAATIGAEHGVYQFAEPAQCEHHHVCPHQFSVQQPRLCGEAPAQRCNIPPGIEQS
jgi:hypothetical protein